MSLSNLNKKAVSGKFKVADIVAAIASVVLAVYCYVEYGMGTATYLSMAGVVISVMALAINPAKLINNMLIKRQLK
tara:strand:- start:298 stop:525 length:228 start_codon:yes stop_codon:yes gene_type:complete